MVNLASPDSLSDQALAEIYPFAIKLAKDAGKLLLDSLHQRRRDSHDPPSSSGGGGNNEAAADDLELTEKLNAVDIVTKTDTEVEEFIHSSIATAYPTHAFVGEEMYSRGSSKEYVVTRAPTWIVDP
jgi:myo-inositol-1(or 4)-monophosphatase